MSKQSRIVLSGEEIFAKVREVLVDALSLDDDEVTPEAEIADELGAESIDFLDIVFRLEKAFDIKIDQGDLFISGFWLDQFSEKYQDESFLRELSKAYPHLGIDEMITYISTQGDDEDALEEIKRSQTVVSICRFISIKYT